MPSVGTVPTPVTTQSIVTREVNDYENFHSAVDAQIPITPQILYEMVSPQ